MSNIPPEIICEIIRVAPYETFCSFAKSCKKYLGFCKSILSLRIDEWVVTKQNDDAEYECLPNGYRHGLEWSKSCGRKINLYNFGHILLEANLGHHFSSENDIIRCYLPDEGCKWFICYLHYQSIKLEQLKLNDKSYLSCYETCREETFIANMQPIKLYFNLALNRFSYRQLYHKLIDFDICKFIDERLKCEDDGTCIVYRGNDRHLILENEGIQIKINGTFHAFHRHPLYYMDNAAAKEQIDKIMEDSPEMAPILKTYFGPDFKPSFFVIFGLKMAKKRRLGGRATHASSYIGIILIQP